MIWSCWIEGDGRDLLLPLFVGWLVPAAGGELRRWVAVLDALGIFSGSEVVGANRRGRQGASWPSRCQNLECPDWSWRGPWSPVVNLGWPQVAAVVLFPCPARTRWACPHQGAGFGALGDAFSPSPVVGVRARWRRRKGGLGCRGSGPGGESRGACERSSRLWCGPAVMAVWAAWWSVFGDCSWSWRRGVRAGA